MQDMIILGLLQFRSMSAYDIKKAIERSTSNFYNASMGSIHPALKKLHANKAVTIEEIVQNGRLKKIYDLSDIGRIAFANWMAEGVILPRFKDLTLVKVFFLGFTSRDDQIRHLKAHIEELATEVAQLTVLQASLIDIEVPKGAEEHFKFQMATLDFGLQYYKFAGQWYDEFLHEQVMKWPSMMGVE